ncbi:MAG: hypothetical protein AABZ74_07015 [Cyanobacteriota bacterium]
MAECKVCPSTTGTPKRCNRGHYFCSNCANVGAMGQSCPICGETAYTV